MKDSVRSNSRGRRFRIALSIEKDRWAKTLRLRSFFRQFAQAVPDFYYEYLRGRLSLEELFLRYPDEAGRADAEAWQAELGRPDRYPTALIDHRIQKAIGGAADWVLIGGPPCQAYSLAGRSRMSRDLEKYEKDHRHFLYREYLRIIAVHHPPVFVMENVKGILSSKVEGGLIINRILRDLKNPSAGKRLARCTTGAVERYLQALSCGQLHAKSYAVFGRGA